MTETPETPFEFLLNFIKTNKDLRHWNELMGYAIQPVRPIASVWFLRGGGENGKSTALRLMLALLGSASLSCDIQKFSRDFFNVRQLLGKLLLVDEDYSKDLTLNEAFLKKMSEDSQLSGRSPHKIDTLSFKNTALPLLVGNHDPQCNDVTKGWKRRVYAIKTLLI